MKFIQKLYFAGNALQAIEHYKEAFGCTEKSVILYDDAVRNGWEERTRSGWERYTILRSCLAIRRFEWRIRWMRPASGSSMNRSI